MEDTFTISKAGVRLLLGDFRDRLADMESDSVDLIVTDPPFPVISGGSGPSNHKRPKGIISKNDGKIFKHNDIEPVEYMPELFRLLKPGGDAYIMTNNITLRKLLDAGEKAGFRFHGLLFWIKNTCTPSRWYMKNTELVVYFYKEPARPVNSAKSKQTFFADNPRNKKHPTEKPVELMLHYILNSSNPGETVLDPFMGSGTTGVAAFQTGRNFIGVDSDPEYFKTARIRITEAVRDHISWKI